ncbi:MAG: isocitrate/isopropylmalate dehydrogenase family protein [Desulfurococcales archaeon]|nr:isocitrate/isopropylmalate dehydrogenase family protein [Desulfurococcales archaeon]
MVRRYRVGVIEGDGVGPEVINAALKLLQVVNRDFELVRINAGYSYFRKSGKLLEDGAIEVIKSLDAVIKGSLTTLPAPGTFRSVNVLLRQELDLYANVRPFRSFRGISLRDLNFVIVRENTEGLYSGVEGRFRDVALSTKVVTKAGCERVIRYAFSYARAEGFRKVTAVHKANVLKVSDGLFREVFLEVAREFPGLVADEVFVDAAAYYMVKEPERFGVIVTLNLYGDILSDLAAGLVGSLGLCGSAQIGDSVAIFEPVHGSAPDIAGKGVANPVGAITSLSLMLKYLGVRCSDGCLLSTAKVIDEAVKKVIEGGRKLTPDLGGSSSTEEVATAILKEVESMMSS